MQFSRLARPMPDFRGSGRARYLLIAFFCLIAIALGFRNIYAAPPVVATTPAASATAVQKAAAQEAANSENRRVLSFLGTVLNWYDHLAVERQLVTEPAEMLFVVDDRQMANEVVKLAFEYARARAALIANRPAALASAPIAPPSATSKKPAAQPVASGSAATVPTLSTLSDRLDKVQLQLAHAQEQVKQLQMRLKRASPRQRNVLKAQLAGAQGEVALSRSRLDALKAILDFETNSGAAGHHATGLIGQIDELARSIPQAREPGKAAMIRRSSPQFGRSPMPSGILDLVERLLAFNRKQAMLADTVNLTKSLSEQIDHLRAPLAQRLHAINHRGAELAAHPVGIDLAEARQRKQIFEALVHEHKLNVAAILPLAEINVILNQYTLSLQRWERSVDRRSDEVSRRLIIRLIVLGALLAMIAIAAIVWRHLAFRYIQDVRQRHRILQIRTLTVVVMLVLVLMFNFSSDIGALATVMGLATAGVAFALQNVILSVAGYFFLSGRYGVKVGDWIQLAGVYGTVIDIGLVKLTMMELSGEGNARQPSGRIVVFANSIVFQSNGNFFKPAPGLNFVWNELSLTLAPDCDHKLAEKLLTDAVNDVFTRYREEVRREYRETMRHLNLWDEPPEPQSRLLLGAAGLKVTIRYPAEARRALDISDEISRRLLNVISHEPRLKLVGPDTPTIQAVTDGAPAETVEPVPAPIEGHPSNPVGAGGH